MSYCPFLTSTKTDAMLGSAGAAPAKGPPWPPTVAWYAVMEGLPAMRASTFWVSESVSDSVEFTGIVIAIGKVGLEDWSSRFTRKRGIRAIEATKKAAAAPRVSRRWLVAHWITAQ